MLKILNIVHTAPQANAYIFDHPIGQREEWNLHPHRCGHLTIRDDTP